MIRLILVLLFVVLYLILTLPVLGILWLIRRKHPKEADLASLRMVQWAFRVILFLAGTCRCNYICTGRDWCSSYGIYGDK